MTKKKKKRLRHGHLDHCSCLVKKRFVDPNSPQKLAGSGEKVEGKRQRIDHPELLLLAERHLADEFELKLH